MDLLNTYDYCFTVAAHEKFVLACKERLAEAQSNGKGYFMDCDPAQLEKLMIDAIHEMDYCSVANYAMMMRAQMYHGLEKKQWANLVRKV